MKLHDEIDTSAGGGRWVGPACHVPDIVHSTVRNRIRNRGCACARHPQSALTVMSGADSLALLAVATVAERASG